jgi:hypothetical protein
MCVPVSVMPTLKMLMWKLDLFLGVEVNSYSNTTVTYFWGGGNLGWWLAELQIRLMLSLKMFELCVCQRREKGRDMQQCQYLILSVSNIDLWQRHGVLLLVHWNLFIADSVKSLSVMIVLYECRISVSLDYLEIKFRDCICIWLIPCIFLHSVYQPTNTYKTQ